MASLEARSSLRSAHPLLLLTNKLISFIAFVVLLSGGWVALNYIRGELQGFKKPPAAAAVAPVAQSEQSLTAVGRASSGSLRLVYFCTSDSGYYHAATHLEHCRKTALSEDAALSRGLKRCTVCLPR